MENLPTDIIEDIFSRLPVAPTLLQCRRVSKTWRDILRNYKTGVLFTYRSEGKIQLYYTDQEEVTRGSYYSNKTLTKFEHAKYSCPYRDYMVGSCNGLVCLCSGICNPLTGEFLTFSDRIRIFSVYPQGIGFGYLPSTNEYKVVRTGFSNRRRQGAQGHVEVYTLGSQSGWRRKKNIPYRFSMPGIFVNGAIHWMCKTAENQYKISAFDLADEKFKDVPLPTLYNPYPWQNVYAELLLLRGNLCLIHCRYHESVIDIWAFKKNKLSILSPTVEGGKYYDNNWSWTRDFRLLDVLSRPFAITESNEVLRRGHHLPDKSCLQAIPHINTRVSLKELGERTGNHGDKSVNGSRG